MNYTRARQQSHRSAHDLPHQTESLVSLMHAATACQWKSRTFASSLTPKSIFLEATPESRRTFMVISSLEFSFFLSSASCRSAKFTGSQVIACLHSSRQSPVGAKVLCPAS